MHNKVPTCLRYVLEQYTTIIVTPNFFEPQLGADRRGVGDSDYIGELPTYLYQPRALNQVQRFYYIFWGSGGLFFFIYSTY